jgi:hypothetical protein
MMTMRRQLPLVVALVLVSFGLAFAQGTQTGSLTGTVRSADRQPVPGVSVNLKSPSLLGTRTAITDVNGGYIFKALPPGSYKISYELSGFATVEKSVTLALGSTLPVDVTMTVATVQENVVVTAEVPSPLTTTQVGANYKSDMIDSLAIGRNLAAITALAPGLIDANVSNTGQVKIAGNFGYDNVFLVDGVDINDNLFGTAHLAFIEDAIDETQVLTSGISAEYGRFGGGVINAVTKRGGNDFSGSFRVNFSNPSWRDTTPFEKQQGIKRQDTLNKFYEATLGGPLVKDHLWFFAAGRKEGTNTQLTLPESGLPFTQTRDQKRGEIKLSGAINPNHTVTVSYTKVSDALHRTPFDVDIDPIHDAFNGNEPVDLFVANYNGVLRPNLFLELQVSRKTFQFQNEGGTSTNIIDSPYLAQSAFLAYNAPYFDATDPEHRDNRQLAGSLSYFLSTQNLGKHDLKLGFENYRSQRTGGNSQSSTNYVFYTDYATDASGKPLFDSNGYVEPVFTPGVSQLQNWQAVRGAVSYLTTNSAYLNDKWTLSNHWGFNLGVRAEWEKSEATGNIRTVSANRIVPRLGASFDVNGDGKFKLDATYSHYAGKLNETQFLNNTNVGNPNAIYYLYTGPAGQGRAFAPGIDPANYSQIIGGTFPTANVKYSPDIKTPLTHEITGAAGMELGRGGYLKAIYTYRKIHDFVQKFVTTKNGFTDVVVNGIDFGTFTNQLWANDDTGLREYSALQFQAGYRPTSRWNLQGHYTLMLKNDGNQEGEGPNQPGAPSFFSGYYPELFDPNRLFPVGHLLGFQRHRARAWSTYDLGLGKAGNVSLGLLYRFDSGTAYSIRQAGAGLTSVQKAIGAALYPDLPTSQTIYFAPGRGSQFFEDAHLVDFSINWGVPIYKSAKPWVKFEIRNLFDSTPLINPSISGVRADPNSPKDALGIPTGYTIGGTFLKGTATSAYPFPREYFVSLGFRF